MSKAADKILSRFGGNLSESLGVRTESSAPAGQFPREIGPPATSPDDGRTRAREAGHMEIDRIIPDPDQPRKHFDPDELERLASSLRTKGQLQPIRVRWNEDRGKWVVISGERRYRAAIQAGLKTVACIFTDGQLTPAEILQEQLIENLLREDLKPVEAARAYRQLMDAHGWTAKELSGELHVSPASISKALSLLDLPEDLQGRVDAGDLAPSVAYEVARVDDEQAQRDLAERIVAHNLTREDAVEAVRKTAGFTGKSKGRGAARSSTRKGKPAPIKTRVLRVASGRVTIDLRRAGDASAMLVAAEEAVAMLRAEVEGQGAEAA